MNWTPATVMRERFKYAIIYSRAPGCAQICMLTFWLRSSAELYAATLNAAFQDGMSSNRPTAQGSADPSTTSQNGTSA